MSRVISLQLSLSVILDRSLASFVEFSTVYELSKLRCCFKILLSFLAIL